MRVPILRMVAALAVAMAGALAVSGCSLTIDPNSVPAPGGGSCTPVCAGKTCGSSDGCTGTCTVGSGCTCVSTGCSTVACGQVDNCGNTCAPGSGCVPLTHLIEGGVTDGGASSVGASHRVTGTIGGGAAPQQPANATHKIEQGTLR